MRIGATIFGRVRDSKGIFGVYILCTVDPIVDAIIDSLLNFADPARNKLTCLLVLFLEDVVFEIKLIIGFFIIFNLVFVLLLFSLHLFNHVQ